MDELSNLSAFLKVVERGSLTSAAAALNCSTSTVSKRIKQLEHTVGATLLTRSTHGIARPTEAGQAYFDQVRLIIGGLEHAKDTVRSVTNSLKGRLKVHLTPGTSLIVVPSIIRFARTYPALEIQVSVRPEVHDVLQRGFDVTIHSVSGNATEVGYTSIEAREIAPMRYVICAAPAYLEAHGHPTSPRDLTEHNCLVSIRQQSGSKWRFRDGSDQYEVTVGGSFEADNWITIRDAMTAGLGIARMSRIGDDPLVGEGLVTLFDEEVVSDRSLWAFMPRMHPTPHKLEVFLRFLADDVRSLPARRTG